MSFTKYLNHRDSGIEWVGQIPEHWTVAPLLSAVTECDRPNVGMQEDNLLSLSFGQIVRKDIGGSDGLLPESFETYQIIESGDIVWRLTDLQNDKRSLRTALVPERGIITSAYLATAVREIEPKFLHYLLRAYDLHKVFYAMGGGLRQSMKFADVRRMPILIPPIEEQMHIVRFLDRETSKIDNLVLIATGQRLTISGAGSLMSLLHERRAALISAAVTGKIDIRSIEPVGAADGDARLTVGAGA